MWTSAEEPSRPMAQQVQRPPGGHLPARQNPGQSRCFLLYPEKPTSVELPDMKYRTPS